MKSRRIPNQFVSQFSRQVSHENGYVKYERQESAQQLTREDLEVVKREWRRAEPKYELGVKNGNC